MAWRGLAVVFLALVLAQAFASGDPSPLHDFHSTDKNSKCFLQWFDLQGPDLATPGDFFFSSLDIPGKTVNNVGSNVTLMNAAALPRLNTLSISITCINYVINGLNLLHTHPHPRATEILTIIKGKLYISFVTLNLNNSLFIMTVAKGDMFVFPIGFIHFQFNINNMSTFATATFSSQNPGVITIAKAIFRSKPPINDDVLAKVFQVDAEIIDGIKSKLVS